MDYADPIPGDITTGVWSQDDWWRLQRPTCDQCGHHLTCYPTIIHRDGDGLCQTTALGCAWCGTYTPLDHSNPTKQAD